MSTCKKFRINIEGKKKTIKIHGMHVNQKHNKSSKQAIYCSK